MAEEQPSTQELLKTLKHRLGESGNFRIIYEDGEDLRHVELNSEYIRDDTTLSTFQARFSITEDVDLLRTEVSFESTEQPVVSTQALNASHEEMTKLVIAWLEWLWSEEEDEEE